MIKKFLAILTTLLIISSSLPICCASHGDIWIGDESYQEASNNQTVEKDSEFWYWATPFIAAFFVIGIGMIFTPAAAVGAAAIGSAVIGNTVVPLFESGAGVGLFTGALFGSENVVRNTGLIIGGNGGAGLGGAGGEAGAGGAGFGGAGGGAGGGSGGGGSFFVPTFKANPEITAGLLGAAIEGSMEKAKENGRDLNVIKEKYQKALDKCKELANRYEEFIRTCRGISTPQSMYLAKFLPRLKQELLNLDIKLDARIFMIDYKLKTDPNVNLDINKILNDLKQMLISIGNYQRTLETWQRNIHNPEIMSTIDINNTDPDPFNINADNDDPNPNNGSVTKVEDQKVEDQKEESNKVNTKKVDTNKKKKENFGMKELPEDELRKRNKNKDDSHDWWNDMNETI